MKYMLYLISFLLFSIPLQAEEQPQRPEVSPGNVPEGEIVIRTGKVLTLHEYRRNGQVYKVKVIPKKGRPYYIVDSNGDGELDQMQWILMSW